MHKTYQNITKPNTRVDFWVSARMRHRKRSRKKLPVPASSANARVAARRTTDGMQIGRSTVAGESKGRPFSRRGGAKSEERSLSDDCGGVDQWRSVDDGCFYRCVLCFVVFLLDMTIS